MSGRNEIDLDAVRARLARAASQYDYTPVTRRVGSVSAVADGLARVTGLEELAIDELVVLDGRTPALVLDLDDEGAGVALLAETGDLVPGAPVRGSGDVVSVPVGESLLGRVLDPLGAPLDGGPPLSPQARWPIERPAPPIVARAPVQQPLMTGVTVLDALVPIGLGQRELLIGDRGTGKTTLAVDTVMRQRSTGVRCVYVSIGQQSGGVVSLLDRLRSNGALEHSVVIVAAASAPPGLRFVAPYAGATVAEYFRDAGQDALVVFDDLSAHAIAYRELSLLLRRPPGREAYPGDIFYVHSRLLERATHLDASHGGGSLTALPIAETEAGRISAFIPTNLISITDGQIYLEPTLFDRGFKPAVDVGLSVSRVGGKTQRPAMKAVAGTLRLDLARHRELEVFSRFGARLEASTERLLRRGERIRELLKQAPGSPRSPGEQVATLVALEEGCLDDVALAEVSAVGARLLQCLRNAHPDLLEALDTGPPADDDARRRIRQCAQTAKGEGVQS